MDRNSLAFDSGAIMDQLADWDLGEDFDDDNDWHPPGELPSSSSDDEDEQEARDSTVASPSLSNKWTRRRFFGKPMPTLILESTEEVLTPSEYFDRTLKYVPDWWLAVQPENSPEKNSKN
ncbi:unnamed protein product [Parnassius apollo]|uniref:(apollo) hypothetical protein n=1 Tax=Parnassius apollo TaxID=110799 RepID=A0A8S3XN54_PARAO|nr:unnamed protein product [Parnassius apollo]